MTFTKLDSIAQQMAPLAFQGIDLPDSLKAPLKALYYVHFIQKSTEELQFYKTHEALFIGGRIFEKAFGNTPGSTQIAQIVVIASAILQVTEKTLRVKQALEEIVYVVQEIFGSPAFYFSKEFSGKPMMLQKTMLLCSLTIYFPRPLATIVVQIEEVVRLSLHLLQMLWALARSLMDVLDACLLDKCTQSQALLGIGAHVVQAYRSLSTNSELLLAQCQKHEATVDHVLHFFGAKMKGKELIATIRSKIQTLEHTEGLIAKTWDEAKTVALNATFDTLLAHTGYAHPQLLSAQRMHKIPTYPVRSDYDHHACSYTTRKTGYVNPHNRFYEAIEY